MEFQDRNVVITGAGRPGQVGEAVATALAARGARVLLVDRQATHASARAEALVSNGHQASAFTADLSDLDAVARLATEIRDVTGGSVHALVHVAGSFSMSGSVADSDPGEWTRLFTINSTTTYLVARAFIPMLRATRGSFVGFASEAVLPGASAAGRAAYAASKSAVVALVHAIAREEREHGVRANAVAPSTIRTGDNIAALGDSPSMVSREAVADTVCWLASDASRAVTGQILAVR